MKKTYLFHVQPEKKKQTPGIDLMRLLKLLTLRSGHSGGQMRDGVWLQLCHVGIALVEHCRVLPWAARAWG